MTKLESAKGWIVRVVEAVLPWYVAPMFAV
jgi:hypothetical protein